MGRDGLYMKIALINGSPKAKDSASGSILMQLQKRIREDNEILELQFRKNELNSEVLSELALCDCLVFAFPLYVDGIPSHLLIYLKQLEDFFSLQTKKEIRVYCLVNCGFYEGDQTEPAMDIMKNWCNKAGLNWGQGIGIGTGGMILSVENASSEHKLKKSYSAALDTISENISSLNEAKSIYTNFNIPRLLYKLGGNMGWRKQIKNNGLRVSDLNRRIVICTLQEGHV